MTKSIANHHNKILTRGDEEGGHEKRNFEGRGKVIN